MIHILILIVLGLAAYLFHNYQTFNDAYMRPWVVEQVNFNREADPQALCDLLSPDVVVDGGKMEACKYFADSAKNFQKPQKEKNGYIWDRLSEYTINHEDLFKDYADITFATSVQKNVPDLITKEGDILVGRTTTRLTVKSPIFKDSKITSYTFNRKLVQANLDN